MITQVATVRDDLRKKKILYGGWREEGAPKVHIGPEGELDYGLGGNHRWAIFLALGLSSVPVQIGVVHKEGIRSY